MSKLLIKKWRLIADEFEIDILTNANITLSNGFTFVAEVVVPHFGAPNGMIIFTRPEIVAKHGEDIVQSGYGFSILSEPKSSAFDRETVVSMLSDWGWSGEESLKPSWITENLSDE